MSESGEAGGQAVSLPPALGVYARDPSEPARDYPDLHDHVLALHRAGLLRIIDEPVNKDTQMHPLVRLQYRGGIPEEQRRAFFFAQPVDTKGRHYDGPVLVAGLAGNRAIYRIGFGRDLDEIGAAWRAAIANPVKTKVVDRAPCQDVVVTGDALGRDGLGALPVPISSPGWDNAPYLSAGHYITRDPDTGVQNLGTYRGQLKGPKRLGMNASVDFRQGIYQHWLKYKARGQPMPVCAIVGCPPILSYAAGYKVPDHLDELDVAGALVGSPINVVKAKTVDLLVPAEAEYVIEGFISTEFLEPEGPFGESHGHVNLQEFNAYMDVTAITRRRHPILLSIISQVTPSESSTIRRSAMEPELFNFLRYEIGVAGVKRVYMHEPLTAVLAVFIIQFRRNTQETEVWRALHAAAVRYRFGGRWIVAVDEDIDPENCDAVFWSMSYRCQPQHDVKMVPRKEAGHGPRGPKDNGELAAVLVNATLKVPSAPIALPAKEFMEDAIRMWERLGLPDLSLQSPWYGYELGGWAPELARQARMAVNGDYFALGDELAQRRRGDVDMNTPISYPLDGDDAAG